MDYTLWTNKAIMKIGELKTGDEFALKDLFSGIEWNELETGEKRSFGRYFKNAVNTKMIPNIVLVGKNKASSALYQKIK